MLISAAKSVINLGSEKYQLKEFAIVPQRTVVGFATLPPRASYLRDYYGHLLLQKSYLYHLKPVLVGFNLKKKLKIML